MPCEFSVRNSISGRNKKSFLTSSSPHPPKYFSASSYDEFRSARRRPTLLRCARQRRHRCMHTTDGDVLDSKSHFSAKPSSIAYNVRRRYRYNSDFSPHKDLSKTIVADDFHGARITISWYNGLRGENETAHIETMPIQTFSATEQTV